jgi:hypothetical protein
LSRQAGTEPHAWETGQMNSITNRPLKKSFCEGLEV